MVMRKLVSISAILILLSAIAIPTSGDALTVTWDGWANRWGATNSSSHTYAEFVTTDAAGNAYVAGNFINSVDFDPSAGQDIRNIANGMYLSKFTREGTYVRTTTWDAAAGDLAVWDVKSDALGNVTITAFLKGGTIDFDPTAGEDIRTVAESNTLGNSSAIIHINADGTYGWTKIIGKQTAISGFNPRAYVSELQTFSNGDVIAIGNVAGGTVNLNPDGSDEFTAPQGAAGCTGGGDCDSESEGYFVSRWSQTGTYLGTSLVLLIGGYYGSIVTPDDQLYISGSWQGNGNPDPTGVQYEITIYPRVNDAIVWDTTRYNFISTFSSSGEYLESVIVDSNSRVGNVWDSTFGIQELELDSFGNLYFDATYTGDIDFENDDVVDLVDTGSPEHLRAIGKLDSDGSVLWAKNAPTPEYHSAYAHFAIDSQDTLIVFGRFNGATEFDSVDHSSDVTSGRGNYKLHLTTDGEFTSAEPWYISSDSYNYGGISEVVMSPLDDLYLVGTIRSSTKVNPYTNDYYYSMSGTTLTGTLTKWGDPTYTFDPVDLYVSLERPTFDLGVVGETETFSLEITNNSNPESVDQFSIDFETEHLSVESVEVTGGAATDNGSFDYDTGTWTGQLDGYQYLELTVTATVLESGAGEQASITSTVSAGYRDGDAIDFANVPQSTSTFAVDTLPVFLDIDIALPTGTINQDSTITTTVTITNDSSGQLDAYTEGEIGFYLFEPPELTPGSSLTNGFDCFYYAPARDLAPYLATYYEDYGLTTCLNNSPVTIEPQSQLQMEVSSNVLSDFVAFDTSVIAVLYSQVDARGITSLMNAFNSTTLLEDLDTPGIAAAIYDPNATTTTTTTTTTTVPTTTVPVTAPPTTVPSSNPAGSTTTVPPSQTPTSTTQPITQLTVATVPATTTPIEESATTTTTPGETSSDDVPEEESPDTQDNDTAEEDEWLVLGNFSVTGSNALDAALIAIIICFIGAIIHHLAKKRKAHR
jgi:hypothetical protein